MTVEVKKEAGQKDAKSAVLLNKYLSGAVVKMDGMTKKEAQKYATAEAEKIAAKGGIDVADIEAKESAVKEGMKQFGLKEKLNYVADGKAFDGDIQKSMDTLLTTGVVSTVALISNIMATTTSPEEGSGLAAVIGVGLTAVAAERLVKAGLRAVTTPKSDEGKAKVADYTEMKHTQVALKQLKKAIQGPEKAAEKAAQRKAYKDEVRKTMAMTMGPGVVGRAGGR